MQIGPYQIERELGRGGMGAVYLGREAPGAAPVAIKVVHTALNWDPDVEARFRAEGDALEALAHPNLVRLRGRGRGPGGHWIAMDYVEGQSLGVHLGRHGPWRSEAARDLLLGLCAGVAYAHHAGVLHRDLKPENIILRHPDLHPMIVDFGLARPLDLSQHLTATGEILGSPGYLAPEQCGSGGQPTRATDVYGLGAVLYTILTGHPPFRAASVLGTLDLVLSAAPRPPRELSPEVAPWLEAVCLRCLAKEPSERFEDAAALADALLAGQANAPVARGRGGTFWAGVAALTLAAVAGLAYGVASRQVEGAASPSPSLGPALSPSPSASAEVERWREGTWGERHAELGERADLEALEERYRLLASEADQIELREAPWVARRARAREIARSAAATSPEAAAVWVRTVALDDVFGDPIDERSELVAARDRARELVKGPSASLREQLLEPLARLELVAWRESNPDQRAEEEAAVLAAWSQLSNPADEWWRGAVRVEILSRRDPPRALESLEEIELTAGSPSAKAWVEYLRARFLRISGAGSPSYLGLLKEVAEWPGVAATLRAKALLLLGSQLASEHDPRARAVLESVDRRALTPWRRFGLEVHLARLSLRKGQLEETRALLAGLPDQLSPELAFPIGLLRAELLAREGKLDEAEAALVLAPPPRGLIQHQQLLYLRAVLGQVDHAEGHLAQLERLGAWGLFEAERIFRLAAEDPLWGSRPQGGVERLARRSVERISGGRLTGEMLQQLLRAGRWRVLIRHARQNFAQREPRRYASLVAHALLAAEELGVSREVIAEEAAEAAKAVEGISPRKAQTRALLGSVALRQKTPDAADEPQARRATVYVETFEKARLEDPPWDMGWSELIKLYTWAGRAHPEFRGLASGVAREWRERQPETFAAILALVELEPNPERLRALQARVQKARAEKALSLMTFRGIVALQRRHELGGAKTPSWFPLVHEPIARPLHRRRLQLEEARRLLLDPTPGNAQSALVLLRRVGRWCPPEGRAEFGLLAARAHLALGDSEAAGIALTEVRADPALGMEAGGELLMLEARRLQLMGRPRQEFGAKLIAGVAAGLTPASSLDYARIFTAMGGGSASAKVYGQALGFPRSLWEVDLILRELQAAKGDPLVALEVAARDLALRTSAARAFHVLVDGTKGLPQNDALDELRAKTLVRFSRSRLARGVDLPRVEGDGLFRPSYQEVAELLLEIHRVRRSTRARGGALQLPRLRALESDLARHVRERPPEFVRSWALRWELAQIPMDVLPHLEDPRERVRVAERAEALFAQAAEEGPPELERAMDRAFVLGEILRRDAAAAEVLEAAVKRAREAQQREYAGVLARAQAIFLFNQGLHEKALAALGVATGAGLEPSLRGESYLQLAHVLARLGRWEEVRSALRRARVSTPLHAGLTLFEVTVLEARWASTSLPEARRRLGQIEDSMGDLRPHEQTLVRGMIRVAEAELLRREGSPERALAHVSRAMEEAERLPPGAVDERLACYEALGAKSRADLLSWGPKVLRDPSLLTYEAVRIREALGEAKGGD